MIQSTRWYSEINISHSLAWSVMRLTLESQPWASTSTCVRQGLTINRIPLILTMVMGSMLMMAHKRQMKKASRKMEVVNKLTKMKAAL